MSVRRMASWKIRLRLKNLSTPRKSDFVLLSTAKITQTPPSLSIFRRNSIASACWAGKAGVAGRLVPYKKPKLLIFEICCGYIIFTMLTLLTRRAARSALTCLLKAPFSGGHHPKAYDWRDDHSLNPYFEQDPRTLGVQDPFTYAFPFEAELAKPETPFPDNYNPKDLSTNFVGSWGTLSVAETNPVEVPTQVLWDDIAHEWDYESEDLDFQPETFKSQHFRKRGLLWMWVILGLTPYWYVIDEHIYVQMVDADGMKYQRPPPLNYPDDEDTPDFETHDNWKSPEFTYLWDAGLLRDP